MNDRACPARVDLAGVTFACGRKQRQGKHTEHRHIVFGKRRSTTVKWHDESPGAWSLVTDSFGRLGVESGERDLGQSYERAAGSEGQSRIVNPAPTAADAYPDSSIQGYRGQSDE